MKFYCLIRKDLEKNYQGVQAGHSIAQYFIEHGTHPVWDNGTMIYLGVKNEQELINWSDKLSDTNHSTFIEPDIGDEMTALSIIADGSQFKKLSLLR